MISGLTSPSGGALRNDGSSDDHHHHHHTTTVAMPYNLPNKLAEVDEELSKVFFVTPS